jgi:hypothetical protein
VDFIAPQLGHNDMAMVAKVYGRFKPDGEERDRWEKILRLEMPGNGRPKVPSVVPTKRVMLRKSMNKAPQLIVSGASDDSRGI